MSAQEFQPAFKRVQQETDFDCAFACIAMIAGKIDYLAYRRANAYALKNAKTGEIKATTSYKDWTGIIAGLFDFRLQLQTHQDQTRQATPPYLFLPYYIDQDGGWLKPWNSFDKLSQFHGSWKKMLISYATGQRPNEYFLAKLNWSRAKAERKELEQELGAVQTAMNRVKKALPKASVRIDQNAFRQEINDLLRDASALQKEQELLRAKTFSLGASKQSLNAQVQMAKASLRDIEGDLKYLTETQQDGKMICPTCGDEHENAFPVRFELVEDAATLRGIMAELESELQKVEKELAAVQFKISQLRNRERDIEKALQTRKGALKLRDVVESQSAEVVRSVFSTDIGMLRKSIERHDDEIVALKGKVEQYDAPDRAKAINEYYSERVQLFATELSVLQELGDWFGVSGWLTTWCKRRACVPWGRNRQCDSGTQPIGHGQQWKNLQAQRAVRPRLPLRRQRYCLQGQHVPADVQWRKCPYGSCAWCILHPRKSVSADRDRRLGSRFHCFLLPIGRAVPEPTFARGTVLTILFCDLPFQ